MAECIGIMYITLYRVGHLGGAALAGLPANQTIVDRNYRAGHIVGEIGRRKLDDLGAILDRAEPPQGDQFGSIPIALGAAGNDGLHNPTGSDPPGAMQFTVIPNGPSPG